MKTEVDRIDQNKAGETPPRLHWLYAVKSEKDLQVCWSRIVEVVKAIAVRTAETWPTEDEWRELLPEWLVNRFRLYTREEAERLLASLPRERWGEIAWDFRAWLEAMRDRGWEWWSSKIGEDEIEICLSIHEWPARLEAFEQIILAAGGQPIRRTDPANLSSQSSAS